MNYKLVLVADLTEITYHFTNCGSTSHDGPRVIEQCLPIYKQMSSPLADTGTLFQFEAGSYSGAQGFRLPRDDLYNITIAGANGGEGVCNYHYGYGVVIRNLRLWLTTDYEYLILVGHKGTSVCDVPENANHSVCQLPRPTNLPEAQACTETWYNWTTNSQNTLNFNGGGGGGGASMIWPRRTVDKEFTNLPIVISSGGGGASAVLDYDFVVSAISQYMGSLNYPISSRAERTYKFHTSGHISAYDLSWQDGKRGFRVPGTNQVTSGAGGGWGSCQNLSLLNVDGKPLSQRFNFAVGGHGCSSGLNTSEFRNVFGGYGGGGGGCGSGGGGGGYTGGHVIGNINKIAGGGGDAGVFDLSSFPSSSSYFRWYYNDRQNGYVEIVASNCGCDGECVVYTEEREFECLCPNDTLLAKNGYSCFRGEHDAVLSCE